MRARPPSPAASPGRPPAPERGPADRGAACLSPVAPGGATNRLTLALALVAALAPLGGCSNKYKKLSSGSGFGETVFYDLLGGERPPSYYYTLVRDSRDQETFCYRCGDDPYLVDKNVDALQRLGDVPFARLEGQANVIAMLVEVLLEDRSALARSAAAVSLTKIGARLPRYAPTGRTDDGSALASAMGEITRAYAARPAGLQPGERARIATLVSGIGDARFEQGLMTKKALQFFGTTDRLIDETDPGIRAALDTALTRKSREAVVYALSAAVEAPTDFVRADALRGLKVLGEATAVDIVVERMPVEISATVRGEGAEYLGRIGSPEAVRGLLRLLEDADGSVRWRARQALGRVAGQDLGTRPAAWRGWARARFPAVEGFEEPRPADPAAAAR